MRETPIIQKVCLGELRRFIESNHFKHDSVWPITPQRVESYCSNPHAEEKDVVLVYIEEKNEIIAFRTIWADRLLLNGKPVKFGWCSGNWVSTSHRRKGLSGLLLKEVYNDWKGRLMFTNYAPESLSAYIKSGLFPYKIERTGRRFYLNTDFYQLMQQRSRKSFFKLMAILISLLLRIVLFFRMTLYHSHPTDRVVISAHDHYPEDFFDPHKKSHHKLFCREKEEYDWIFSYPWLTTNPVEKVQYPFSQYDPAFRYRFICFEKNEKVIGRLIISNRNGAVKMPYAIALNEDGARFIARYMIDYCYQNKVKTLTVIDPIWAKRISVERKPFLFSRPFSMNIYSTFDVKRANDVIIHDGDGDSIFT